MCVYFNCLKLHCNINEEVFKRHEMSRTNRIDVTKTAMTFEAGRQKIINDTNRCTHFNFPFFLFSLPLLTLCCPNTPVSIRTRFHWQGTISQENIQHMFSCPETWISCFPNWWIYSWQNYNLNIGSSYSFPCSLWNLQPYSYHPAFPQWTAQSYFQQNCWDSWIHYI